MQIEWMRLFTVSILFLSLSLSLSLSLHVSLFPYISSLCVCACTSASLSLFPSLYLCLFLFLRLSLSHGVCVSASIFSCLSQPLSRFFLTFCFSFSVFITAIDICWILCYGGPRFFLWYAKEMDAIHTSVNHFLDIASLCWDCYLYASFVTVNVHSPIYYGLKFEQFSLQTPTIVWVLSLLCIVLGNVYHNVTIFRC